MEKFPHYQESEQRKIENRIGLFVPSDFEGASVLDLGCNSGEMLVQAKSWGAREIFGVEYDKDVILPDRNIMLADLDTVDWNTLPCADVVMLLAVTHWVKEPKRLCKMAEQKCKKVFYYEGHQQEYVPDNFAELFGGSKMKWEKLGENPERRPFYRGTWV